MESSWTLVVSGRDGILLILTQSKGNLLNLNHRTMIEHFIILVIPWTIGRSLCVKVLLFYLQATRDYSCTLVYTLTSIAACGDDSHQLQTHNLHCDWNLIYVINP